MKENIALPLDKASEEMLNDDQVVEIYEKIRLSVESEVIKLCKDLTNIGDIFLKIANFVNSINNAPEYFACMTVVAQQLIEFIVRGESKPVAAYALINLFSIIGNAVKKNSQYINPYYLDQIEQIWADAADENAKICDCHFNDSLETPLTKWNQINNVSAFFRHYGGIFIANSTILTGEIYGVICAIILYISKERTIYRGYYIGVLVGTITGIIDNDNITFHPFFIKQIQHRIHNDLMPKFIQMIRKLKDDELESLLAEYDKSDINNVQKDICQTWKNELTRRKELVSKKEPLAK